MTQLLRLTKTTLHWFLPLLPSTELRALENDPAVHALGAVREKTACGVLVFRLSEAGADIRWLAVSDSFRRQGVAKELIGFLCRHAWESVTPVTCLFSAPDQQDPVYLLFAELENFSVGEEDGYCCSVPIDSLSENKTLSAMRGRGKPPRPYFDLSSTEQKSFHRALPEQNAAFLQELDEDAYVKPLCLCCTGPGGVEAAVFISRTEEDELELSFVWSAPGRQNSLVGLLAEACAQAPVYGQGNLYIAAVNQTSVALVEKLLPQRTITDHFYRAGWDMEL